MTFITPKPVEEDSNSRVDSYRKLARVVRDEGLKKILAAPIKSGWNPTFKQRIPSKREVKRELAESLSTINEFCMEETGVSLVKEPELPNLDI
jgi:hypothetical protein|tara:strand:- start:162 stop:440 length:279 start_codon:yes stop_codon:yes gene_type:complete